MMLGRGHGEARLARAAPKVEEHALVPRVLLVELGQLLRWRLLKVDGDHGGEGLEDVRVLRREGRHVAVHLVALANLVHQLQHRHDVPRRVGDGQTHHVARHEARLLVHLLVEARVRVGVGDVLERARARHVAGNARVHGDLDHALVADALGHPRVEHAMAVVHDEERRALGAHHAAERVGQGARKVARSVRLAEESGIGGAASRR
mmetsp:Transcript_10117/g.29836  ORF Transcript_10117/g.29836 Transcript_10117/m.29836 type:complete len:206 (+) Transcript_10117:1545-2162(+)